MMKLLIVLWAWVWGGLQWWSDMNLISVLNNQSALSVPKKFG